MNRSVSPSTNAGATVILAIRMRSLDTIAALKPAVVVAGHKTPERKDDPSCLEFSKAYLRFYDEALAASKTAEEFRAKMKDRFPDPGLEGVLQMASDAAFAKARKALSPP